MKVIVTATVEVSFEAYPTESENKKAQQHIHQWIKDLLEGGTGRIPLYIEETESGAAIENTTGPIKVDMKSELS